jgi:hypothetical protein
MTTEAKQYAQRNRQGSDWFYHDKPAAVAENPAVQSSEDKTAETVDDKPDVEGVPCEKAEEVAATSTQAQMIKPKSDSNQWSDY